MGGGGRERAGRYVSSFLILKQSGDRKTPGKKINDGEQKHFKSTP